MGDALDSVQKLYLAYRHTLAPNDESPRRNGYIIAQHRRKGLAASRNSFRPVARVNVAAGRVTPRECSKGYGYVPHINQSPRNPHRTCGNSPWQRNLMLIPPGLLASKLELLPIEASFSCQE